MDVLEDGHVAEPGGLLVELDPVRADGKRKARGALTNMEMHAA
jgi:hypothetical protein